MKISASSASLRDARGLLVVPVSKQDVSSTSSLMGSLQKYFGFSLASEAKRRKFKVATGNSLVIETSADKAIKAVLLYSWKPAKKHTENESEKYRVLGACIANSCQSTLLETATLLSSSLVLKDDTNAAALLEGIELAEYRFSRYKRSNKITGIKKLIIAKSKRTISTKARTHAKANVMGTCLARDLVNTPGKDCRPRHLVAAARKIARGTPVSIRVYDQKQLSKMGAGALLSVTAGSSEPPYLIKMTYKSKKKSAKDIALVGKGITFDSGGLSIKPAAGMMDMKIDMGGAAAVLGTMQAIALLKPAVNVTAYIPTCENMINGKASRPGDVVKAINGKTIEVLNTDAEGRLILADALSLASKSKHDVVIDLATLTGSVVVALGEEYAGMFTTTDSLANALQDAGGAVGEKLWRLPLAPEYEKQIMGSISDVKNIGMGRTAGSITAALFLKQFVDAKHWAHLDIAGTVTRKSSDNYNPAGAVGFGVRTLVQYLLKQ